MNEQMNDTITAENLKNHNKKKSKKYVSQALIKIDWTIKYSF